MVTILARGSRDMARLGFEPASLLRRAMAAYYRGGGNGHASAESYVCQFDGRTYVVIVHRKERTVYRARRNGGALRRMRRPPKNVIISEQELHCNIVGLSSLVTNNSRAYEESR